MEKELGKAYLGIDIGGTKCGACLGTSNGTILDKVSFGTERPEKVIRKLIDTSSALIEKHTISITGIGISCGSPLDPDKGIIQSPPNLPGWDNIPITEIFSKEFNVPAFLDNDANAGALAEFTFGAGRGFKNIVFITFGTGCGAGLILDGRVYRGTNCYAGEIGHMRLAKDGPVGYHKKGSMEGFCSGSGLAQLAEIGQRNFSGNTCLPEKATAKDIADAAFAGDKLALKIMNISACYLGKGLSLLIDASNPQRIIIGSIFLRCEKLIRPEMEKILRKECLKQTFSVCEVVPSLLGEKIGDYAALSVAHYSLYKGK
ncbi:MAG: ROK family protein [Victivallales bacterium]|nr:ROK family protein [Victivallales bacterium]